MNIHIVGVIYITLSTMLERLYNTSLLDLSVKDAQVIAQQCNCISKNVKGLSYDIAKRFPYADFYSTRSGHSKTGTIALAGKKKERKVLAMFAQFKPGGPSKGDTEIKRIWWFTQCLERIGRIKNLRSVAFPSNIGCGLAGGDWEQYEEVIEAFAKENSSIKVILCSLSDPPESEEEDSSSSDEPLSCIPNHKNFHHYKCLLDNALDLLSELNYSTRRCSKCSYWTHEENWDMGDGELCEDCFEDDKSSMSREDESQESSDEKEESSDDESAEGQEPDDSRGDDSGDEEDPFEYADGLELVVKTYQDIFEESGWWNFFVGLIKNQTIAEVDKELTKDVKAGVVIFPPPEEVFNAMILTPLNDLKVVIIGQDPYHTPDAAMGLAFGHHNDRGQTIQPSLRNIYTELKDDGYDADRKSGDLSKWAEEGVFLINTALTVRQGQPNSHKGAWTYFTTQLLRYLSTTHEHLVVIMWGKHAQSHTELFDVQKHKLLSSVHPSPFSASNGFFGSKPFSKANAQLRRWKIEPVDWNLV